jgi:hypothetical protein
MMGNKVVNPMLLADLETGLENPEQNLNLVVIETWDGEIKFNKIIKLKC